MLTNSAGKKQILCKYFCKLIRINNQAGRSISASPPLGAFLLIYGSAVLTVS